MDIENVRVRYKATHEQIRFAGPRQQYTNQILRLADCAFIGKNGNVLITGCTGIGKSFVASAIGHQACALGLRVIYEQSTKLFSRLKMTKVDGSCARELLKMEKQDHLIIDVFGMQPLDQQSRALLTKSSKTATVRDRPCLPREYRSTTGTRSSASKPLPMLS